MRLEIDRRGFVAAAAAGLLLPARPALAGLWPASGFTHGVASGNPGPDSVKLWTRYAAPGGGDTMLKLVVARDPGLRRVVARGEALAGVDSWGTAQTEVAGLPQGWLFYRFTAPDGSHSPVGRTRALPGGRRAAIKVAVFGCANKPFGWFNAYAHAAARQDIDLIVHTGDYIYEYARGTYPGAAQALADRVIEPAGEIVALDDYRQRYASYRVDPGLQELHRRFPVVTIWDDHEVANDSWKGGAENHQPAEGDFAVRLAAATRANREWLPQPDRMYQRYDLGGLVSLITLDTRNHGRDAPLSLAKALAGGKDGLLALRDGAWADPSRSLLGMDQEAWFADTIRASVKDGQPWQLVAQQIVMGNVLTPKDALGWLGATPDPRAKGYVGAGLMAAAAGLPGNMDSWGGYPAARRRFLAAAQAADADMVVVSGDSHNAWAFNLAEGGKPAGVEFAGQSVTSPGFESALAADPAVVRAGLVAGNPEMVWCDTSRRGYLTVTFTPDAARADWVFMSTIRDRSLATGPGQAAVARRGRRTMTLV